MLRTRLFQSFAALILIFGILSAWFGVGVIRQQVVAEAQNRVKLDLSSAWSVYHAKLHEIETVVQLAASKQLVSDVCGTERWDDSEMASRLETLRRKFDLDFLGLVGPDGIVRIRTSPPHARGDPRGHDPFIASALAGEAGSGTRLLSGMELRTEAEGLAERAFLELEETPHARTTAKTAESRGMVMVAAEPVRFRGQVVGALYGGVLVNRNQSLIDELKDAIYGQESYEGVQLGTATLFLQDSRIATTVRKNNGNRAIGTRASKEVADQVLDNGRSWVGRAFVVNQWYLTAYDAVRDPDQQIIGMLYVGILEQPFRDLGASIIWHYVGLTAGVMLLSLVVAFFFAGKLAEPIHKLVEASRLMHQGIYPEPVTARHASKETEALTESFNEMTAALKEREERLQALNRSYMETLGFVSHELNTPVGAMTNYIYLLKNRMIGDLTEKQAKAVRVLDHNVTRVTEMVRHYLNLSRIERGEVHPNPVVFAVSEEIIEPLVETVDPLLQDAGMTLVNEISQDVLLLADTGLVREIFENLFSNAIKYGRPGGTITLRSEPAGNQESFSVQNDGEGIPPEAIGGLFKRFSRVAGQPGHARQRGTGLGLFITHHLVEAHGGTISAASEPGAWATFVFTLPRTSQKGAA